jgi:hypothetical protein
MSLLTMGILQNDMLGRCTLYDYQTNGTMMRDIVTTVHRSPHNLAFWLFYGVQAKIGPEISYYASNVNKQVPNRPS